MFSSPVFSDGDLKKLVLISPRGFCAGVERAVAIAQRELAKRDRVYCLHEIVHNDAVVGDLRRKGMCFVDSLSLVPPGSTVIFSAHGVAPQIRLQAVEMGLECVDATCPFVTLGHETIRRNHVQGMRTVVVGDPCHIEVMGYLGEPGACLPEDVRAGENVGRVVQTTLDSSVYGGVCTATRDRQRAVVGFDGDAVLVLGGKHSSNTRKLFENAERTGKRSWLAGSAAEAARIDFSGVDTLGVTSGASTPDAVFRETVAALEDKYGLKAEEMKLRI